MPAVLRPLKERVGNNGAGDAGMVSERRRQRAETVGSLLRSVTSLVIGVLAVMLVLGEIGFNLGPFIAGAGIVGIALGFGAQNLVKDFLSGIFMILEDQYGVGDVVDLGAASGTVEAVGLRVTRLRDGNGTLWYVRNGEILRVGNKSQGFALGHRRPARPVRLGRRRGRRGDAGGGRRAGAPRTTSPTPCWRSRSCSASRRSTSSEGWCCG